MNERDAFIDSADTVREAIERQKGIEVKTREVRKVMKEDLGMSYRKIKPLSVNENIDKNIVLR